MMSAGLLNEKAVPLVVFWYLYLSVALEIFSALTWRSWSKSCYFLRLSMNRTSSAYPTWGQGEKEDPTFTQIPMS